MKWEEPWKVRRNIQSYLRQAGQQLVEYTVITVHEHQRATNDSNCGFIEAIVQQHALQSINSSKDNSITVDIVYSCSQN